MDKKKTQRYKNWIKATVDNPYECVELQDTSLRVRLSSRLLSWLTEAAKIRGISRNRLIVDTLLDNYGQEVSYGNGPDPRIFWKMGQSEAEFRNRLRVWVYDNSRNPRDGIAGPYARRSKAAEDTLGVVKLNNIHNPRDGQWAAVKAMREHNLRAFKHLVLEREKQAKADESE